MSSATIPYTSAEPIPNRWVFTSTTNPHVTATLYKLESIYGYRYAVTMWDANFRVHTETFDNERLARTAAIKHITYYRGIV